MDNHGVITLSKNNDIYFMLLQAIVGQQLSVKAADTIWQRVLGLFKNSYPAAKALLKMDLEKLRTAGLSYQKAGYMKNIAQFYLDGKMLEEELLNKTDEDLIEHLIQIKGVGRWTVEMILMFGLGRPDILPLNDLGIQQGMTLLYGLKPKNKKHLHQLMCARAEQWRPYRTIACMYIWKHKDQYRS